VTVGISGSFTGSIVVGPNGMTLSPSAGATLVGSITSSASSLTVAAGAGGGTVSSSVAFSAPVYHNSPLLIKFVVQPEGTALLTKIPLPTTSAVFGTVSSSSNSGGAAPSVPATAATTPFDAGTKSATHAAVFKELAQRYRCPNPAPSDIAVKAESVLDELAARLPPLRRRKDAACRWCGEPRNAEVARHRAPRARATPLAKASDRLLHPSQIAAWCLTDFLVILFLLHLVRRCAKSSCSLSRLVFVSCGRVICPDSVVTSS
jgi:hypothetical protein